MRVKLVGAPKILVRNRRAQFRLKCVSARDSIRAHGSFDYILLGKIGNQRTRLFVMKKVDLA